MMFVATRNRFLIQIIDGIVADRRAVLFDGHDVDRPTPRAVRRQTHKELAAIVEAIAARKAQARRGADVRSPDAHAGDDQHLAVA